LAETAHGGEALADTDGGPAQENFLDIVVKQFAGLSKDILIYGLGGSLGQVISLITVPIITRILSVGQYGTLDVIYATIGYFAVLMGFNVGSGLWRYYYEVPESDLQTRRKLVSSITWFVILISVPITLIISVFAPEISIALFDSPDQAFAIRMAVYSLPVMALYNLLIGIQRLKRKPGTYISINIGYSLLYFALILLFVWKLRLGIPGIFIAQLIAYSVGALCGIWLARDLLGLTFSKEWFYKMAAFGLPLVPAAFLNWSLSAINRYALNAYSGVVQVGYFSLASKVAQAMILVVTSFTLAWQPFMLASMNKPESRKLYPIALNYYLIITLGIGAFLAIFSREIFLILAPATYLPGAGLVGILVFRQLLVGMDYITGVGIVWAKKTILTSAALGIGVLTSLGVNLLLTPRLGIYGAAIAEMTGVSVSQIAIYFFSLRYYTVLWDRSVIGRSITGYWIVAILSIVSGLLIPQHEWTLLIKLGFWCIYVYFLWRLIDLPQRIILVKIPTRFLGWLRIRLHLESRP
jgi:O-antigen/teichoic acid export membrane protein